MDSRGIPATDNEPIPQHTDIYLISGFLGSGKTLFLRTILFNTLLGSNNAVIVNDFGEVVVDAYMLHGPHSSLVELPGGCLCCSGIDDFRDALPAVLQRRPARIFVETTGLADTARLRKDLAFMHHTVRGVFCLVDALNFPQQQAAIPTLHSQVADADFLLLSKTDLPEAMPENELRAELRALNPRARIIRLHYGHLPTEELIGALAHESHFTAPAHSEPGHLFRDAVSVYRLQFRHAPAESALRAAIQKLPPEVLRAKGMLWIKGTPEALPYFLHYVNGRLDLAPLPPEAPVKTPGQLYLIGSGLDQSMLEHALAALPGISITPGRFSKERSI